MKQGKYEEALKYSQVVFDYFEGRPTSYNSEYFDCHRQVLEKLGRYKEAYEISMVLNKMKSQQLSNNVEEEVAEGRFRQDLFYRLHIVPLTLPPLRERTDDIEPLARHFVDKLRGRTNPDIEQISDEAVALLRNYHFPGNVRELENIVEQALVFANPPQLTPDDLPPQVTGGTPKLDQLQLPTSNVGLTEFLENAERQVILAAYEGAKGVKTETARRLKIKASALYYKLEKYGIGTVSSRPTTEKPET